MKLAIPFFLFRSRAGTIAVIQARNKLHARERASYVSHIVKIPADCQVKRLHPSARPRAFTFSDDFLRRYEEMPDLFDSLFQQQEATTHLTIEG